MECAASRFERFASDAFIERWGATAALSCGPERDASDFIPIPRQLQQWPNAKLEQIPTQWPNLKLEEIPTQWPQLSFNAIKSEPKMITALQVPAK